MNNEIERIRTLDDAIFEEFTMYFPKIKESTFAKQFPRTNLAILLYDTSANFIKNSIFDGCEVDDFFGTKILFRSLIEHYLRFQYVFVNFGLDKSDAFAQTYLDYNDAKEVLEILEARVAEQKLYDPDFKIADWDDFLQGHPTFKNLTRKQIKDETLNYTFKNIIRFLNRNFKDGGQDTSLVMGKLIVEYSELSSYVHGGMKAYTDLMSATVEEKQKQYERICGLTFQLNSAIKKFSLLLYFQQDKEFGEHYLKIDSIIKEFLK